MEDCQALPSSWSSLQDHCIVDEPTPKKTENKDTFRVQPHDETNLFLNGFCKISLPFNESDHHISNTTSSNTNKLSAPSYKRSFSDPSAGLKPSNGLRYSHSAALPPQHPRLGRSFSSPTRMPMMAKGASQSSSCIGMVLDSTKEQATPEYKRKRRINDCMKEMKQLCDELSQHVELDDEATSQDLNIEPTKGWSALPIVEESVSVEKTGECLAVHFNCPCSRGYQILLSGKNCYYKLM